MHRELFEGQLRQVFESGGDLTGFRIREQLPDQLGVDPEAIGDHEQPVLVAGDRLPEVDRALKVAGERIGLDDDSADLGVVGAVRLLLVAELGVGVAAGALPIGGVGVDRQPFGKDQLTASEAGRATRGDPCACGIVNTRSRPDGESDSSLVSSPWATGRKVWRSHSVTRG